MTMVANKKYISGLDDFERIMALAKDMGIANEFSWGNPPEFAQHPLEGWLMPLPKARPTIPLPKTKPVGSTKDMEQMTSIVGALEQLAQANDPLQRYSKPRTRDAMGRPITAGNVGVGQPPKPMYPPEYLEGGFFPNPVAADKLPKQARIPPRASIEEELPTGDPLDSLRKTVETLRSVGLLPEYPQRDIPSGKVDYRAMIRDKWPWMLMNAGAATLANAGRSGAEAAGRGLQAGLQAGLGLEEQNVGADVTQAEAQRAQDKTVAELKRGELKAAIDYSNYLAGGPKRLADSIEAQQKISQARDPAGYYALEATKKWLEDQPGKVSEADVKAYFNQVREMAASVLTTFGPPRVADTRETGGNLR